MTVFGLKYLRRALSAVAAMAALMTAPIVHSAFSAAGAQSGPYTSDLPKQFPTAFARYQGILPYALNLPDWLTKLNGVVSPLRDISLAGTQLKFGGVCVPHDCGGNIAGILFTPRQDRVFSRVELSSPSGAQTIMLMGPMSGAEIACLQKLIREYNLNVC